MDSERERRRARRFAEIFLESYGSEGEIRVAATGFPDELLIEVFQDLGCTAIVDGKMLVVTCPDEVYKQIMDRRAKPAPVEE